MIHYGAGVRELGTERITGSRIRAATFFFQRLGSKRVHGFRGSGEASFGEHQACAARSISARSRVTFLLYSLFDKNLDKAFRILDNRGVTRVTASPSGRVVFQVAAESKGLNEYLCFPEHFCSCPAFHFDVVSRGRQFCCKHQLAARLATSLNVCKELSVSDEYVALLLLRM